MRRSCLLGLTLFLLFGPAGRLRGSAGQGEPRLPASSLPHRPGGGGGGGAASGGQPGGGAGESDVYAVSPGPVPRGLTRTGTKAPSVRGTGFRWGMAALWRRPSPPGWGR